MPVKAADRLPIASGNDLVAVQEVNGELSATGAP
jgi:hypothetical protein